MADYLPVAAYRSPLLVEGLEMQLGSSPAPYCPSRETTIHASFCHQASQAPGTPALIAGNRYISYGTLDGSSEAYARELAKAGVRPGDIVPVTLPPSPELISCLLAVLKTGAAYAGIDPSWPPARVRQVIDQTGARTAVGQLGDYVPQCWLPGVSVETAASQRGGRSAHAGSPEDICCVFFTSGTTGEPRGVLSRHRSTLRLFEPPCFPQFGAGTIIPLAAPISWDGFSLELWGALVSGGTVVVTSEPFITPVALRDMRSRAGINTVWLTASLFNMIVDEDIDSLEGLSQVMTGGERMSPRHARAFLERFPGAGLFNGYGPVESTIFATIHAVSLADCARPDGIPIGHAVGGTDLYVFDGERRCKAGEVGELLIAGDGLAAGYLADPALTAERFVEVTADRAQRRAYRTGDLVRMDSEGVLTYIGRSDRQVKVRGRRIEPAEVEHVLETLPGVRRAVVIPRAATGGGYRDLVAFYRADEGWAGRGDALLTQLRALLPRYMTPELIREVRGFPLTPNGKLDTDLLLSGLPDLPPATALGHDDNALTSDDPATKAVARIFADVLSLDIVPASVSLFSLGGSSLDAGRISARLAEHFGVHVPVSQIVRHSTVAAAARAFPGRRKLRTVSYRNVAKVPLTPMQEGFWLSHQMDRADLANHCVLLFHITGNLDRHALAAAIDDVHLRHEALSARYPAGGPPCAYPQTARPPHLDELEPADSEHATSRLTATLSQPFSLDEGIVWHAVLAPLHEQNEALLGLAVHHIAFDGWSESVLASDLAHAYAARRQGRVPSFPAPAPNLAELYAARMQRLAVTNLEEQRDFWRSVLAGVPDLVFPAPVGPVSGERVRVAHNVIPGGGHRFRALAQRSGIGQASLFAGAYGQVIGRAAGQLDFAVGIPVSKRDAPWSDNAVSCLIDMICVRMRSGPAHDSWPATAGWAATLPLALAAQDVSFQEVVRLINPVRNSRHPLFQTVLAVQNMPAPCLRLPGCVTKTLRPAPLAPMFDLVTEIWGLGERDLRVTVISDRHRVADVFSADLAENYHEHLMRTMSAQANLND